MTTMKLNFNSSIIVLFLMIMIFSLVSCATHPKKIDAAYVSSYKYKNYDCDQIEIEMDHVSQRTLVLYERLKKEADRDKAQGWIGVLLFWPALLLLEGGDGPEAAEYAQLKGEYKALHTNSVEKKCMIAFKSPEEIINESVEADKKEAMTQQESILNPEK